MNQRMRDALGIQDERPKKLVQATVDADLIAEAKKLMKSHELKWGQVLTAGLRLFVAEMKKGGGK